ncbi:MAG: hypothetical protein NTW74_13540 [Acidobacteria bacterium]|nr:hypothetical protein [Acidobacteriota bacterium]
MNQEEELPEVQTQKRNRNRTLPPVQVNDVEDPRCYATLMDRLFTELPPVNIQQEGDLNSMGQLRWTSERVKCAFRPGREMVCTQIAPQQPIEGALTMARKKGVYGILESAPIHATPAEVVETGTVRMALILELLSEALQPYPEAKQAISEAIAARLGASPETRILP